MQSILRNSISNEGIGSLRKTRTSEVSAFVKNYNQAQTRALRKEVEIWHKDTRHALRSMNDQQHKLYSSLLKLSKTKKMIKTQREDEDKIQKFSNDAERKRKDLFSRRMRQANRDRRSVNSLNFLKIDHPVLKEVSHETHIESAVETMVHNEPIYNSSADMALTVENVSAFESSLANLHEKEYLEKVLPEMQENKSQTAEAEKKMYNEIEKEEVENNTKEEEINSNISDKIIELVENANISLNDEVFRRSDSIQKPNGLVLTNPIRSEPAPLLPPSGVVKSRPRRIPRLKDIEFTYFDELTIPEDGEVQDFSPQLERVPESKKHPDQQYRPHIFIDPIHIKSEPAKDRHKNHILSRSNIIQNNNIPVDVQSNVEIQKRRRRKRQNIPTAIRTHVGSTSDISNRSSIQAMEGKQYQVTVYKKDSVGNLTEENEVIDTTVDVAKYFHFSSYRDRLTRQRMLQDARDKEIKQRRRVSEFLVKLSRDEEDAKRRMELSARHNEEARLSLQRRLEAIKKGPPKYGIIDDDQSTPGYVRKYVRPPKNETFRAKRERKRSSWCLPSIYTLNASLNGSNSLSSHNSGRSSRHTQQIKDFNLSSSHLVNINMEKYLTQEAAH